MFKNPCCEHGRLEALDMQHIDIDIAGQSPELHNALPKMIIITRRALWFIRNSTSEGMDAF